MISLSKQNPLRWYELAWWLCVITLPLPDTYNNAAIILLGLVWLADNRLWKEPDLILKNWWAWPFFFYFLWLGFGILYSPDKANGFFTWEKKISYWALPMIAITGKTLSWDFFSFLKRSFVYSCFLIVMICLSGSAYDYFKGTTNAIFDFNSYENFLQLHPDASPVWSRFSYIQLVHHVGLHPTYFSMYLAFCLVILLSEKFQTPKDRLIHLVIGLVIGAFITLLSSRAAILALLIAVLYLGFVRLKQLRLKAIAMMIGVSSLLILFLWINPVSRFRLLEEPLTTSYQVDVTTTNWNSVNYRLLEWTASWSIIKQHFIGGVGTGGWYSSMTDFYSHFNKTTIGLEHNAHNQYLQAWMENGLPGIIAFVLCLLVPVFYAKPAPSYIPFLIIFSVMCLTESVGERQKGIVFFTLFQTLFLAIDHKNS
jgi:hypothetical protein